MRGGEGVGGWVVNIDMYRLDIVEIIIVYILVHSYASNLFDVSRLLYGLGF